MNGILNDLVCGLKREYLIGAMLDPESLIVLNFGNLSTTSSLERTRKIGEKISWQELGKCLKIV